MTLDIIEPQPTEKNPYYVDNYPYGYRQRTQIRYWIETTNRGQRFVRQTLNPKTKKWNKPKKSTYSQIMLIGLNEKNHVTYTSLSMYSTEEALKFKKNYEKYFSEYQKKEIINILKMLEVYDKVEYKFVAQKYRNLKTGEITESVPLFDMNNYEEVRIDEDGGVTPVDRDKEKKEREETNRTINRTAVGNASKETSVKDAVETFKRVK